MYLPIYRCGDLLLRSELQGVDHAEQLVEVPSRGRGVEDGQLQLLVRANHKHLKRDTSTSLRQRAARTQCTMAMSGSYAASREGDSILIQLIGVQHAQLDRQLPLIISDDGVWQRTVRLSV